MMEDYINKIVGLLRGDFEMEEPELWEVEEKAVEYIEENPKKGIEVSDVLIEDILKKACKYINIDDDMDEFCCGCGDPDCEDKDC